MQTTSDAAIFPSLYIYDFTHSYNYYTRTGGDEAVIRNNHGVLTYRDICMYINILM